MSLQEPTSFASLSQKDSLAHLDPSAFLAAPELVRALENRSIPVCCDADRVLFHQGDAPAGFYILKEGEAAVSMDCGREKPILSIRVAGGSLLGLPGAIGNKPCSLTAIARQGAQVRFVSRDDFAAFMQAEPLLSLGILEVLAAEVRSARRALCHR
jgi:CRP-like cAMP-binding protein